MQLALPRGAGAIEGHAVKIQPRTVLFVQLGPFFIALVRGQIRVFVDDMLKFVHLAAIGQEIQSSRKMVRFGAVSLVAIEFLQPGPAKEFHGHGMNFAALQRGRGALPQLSGFRGQVAGEGVAALMGENFHVVRSAVEIGEDKGRLVIGQIRAIAAGHLALFGDQIKQMHPVHLVDKAPGLLVHLPIHLHSRAIGVVKAPLWLGVAAVAGDRIVIEFEILQPQPLGLGLFHLYHPGDNLVDNLLTEDGGVLGVIAVAGHPQIAQLHKILEAQLFGNGRAHLHQLVVNLVVFLFMGGIKIAFRLISGPAGLPVWAFLINAQLREIQRLTLERDASAALELLIFHHQLVFLLQIGQYLRRNGFGVDFRVGKKHLGKNLLQLRPEGGGQHGPVKIRQRLLKGRAVFRVKFLFRQVEGVFGVDRMADRAQIHHGAGGHMDFRMAAQQSLGFCGAFGLFHLLSHLLIVRRQRGKIHPLIGHLFKGHGFAHGLFRSFWQ